MMKMWGAKKDDVSRWGRVDAYLNGPFKEIGGWCIPFLWQGIQPLVDAMTEEGEVGPVAEIGVYHGKFLIGLVDSAGAAANNYAIDVFEDQEYNLDKAGKGDLEIFRNNLALSGVSDSRVTIRKADSLALTSEDVLEIRRQTGGFSLFSVDGCHTPEHTINDVRIAMELTRQNGVIFVDDYYNVNWPGVQEGISKLYFFDAPRFVPLLFMSNKLFLCHYSVHAKRLATCEAFMRENHPTTRLKRVSRFGYDGLSAIPDPAGHRYLVT